MISLLVGLRYLTRQSEELLALAVSVVEQQAEELCIDTSRGGEGGWHKGNALVIRIIRLDDDDDWSEVSF